MSTVRPSPGVKEREFSVLIRLARCSIWCSPALTPRVCPSVTLGLQPGEAFTVRNIANMVPSYDKVASLWPGPVRQRRVRHRVRRLRPQGEVIVVIGHSRCGGIKALLSLKDGTPDTFHFVEDWVRIGCPAKEKRDVPVASLNILQEAVNMSLENLKSYPFVKEGLEKGTIKLVGAHYAFVDGKFETWDH
ncbi:hypothetical protein PR202_ga03660 [Eleusine coracana subsp. coracana]|uniref:Carbonic anhydrase n=1 Tax=Eleusine coracana subsp. coracana TaxID=191504 RepID=A0AAV5BP41_ELECO|nr:hypothetical protein PR202_ga03660 [Eleusine coracana subsp. coracana]